MGPVVIVIVRPFLKLVVEQMDIVADAILVEQLVKLLLVDTVGALDLAVQTRGSRADVDVPDVLLLQVPVEVGLELCAIVSLDYEHSEGKPSDDLVHEADGRLLVADVVDFEHTDARAVIDGRELIEAFLGTRYSLKEFHVDLQAMARLRLLVSVPGTARWLALLINRQPVHSVTDQYAVHGGTRYVYAMKAMQIAGDPSRTKPVSLPQIQDLGDDRARRCLRAMKRRSGTIAQTGLTVTFEPSSPFVEGFAGKAEMPAGLSYAPGQFVGLP
jgi:hypothetical protein